MIRSTDPKERKVVNNFEEPGNKNSNTYVRKTSKEESKVFRLMFLNTSGN